jgi:arylsulfatase A-like enzyme
MSEQPLKYNLMNKSITSILAFSALAHCAVHSQPANIGSAPRPNILLIMADDLGYHDVGVHGLTDFPTPHLDRLANSGVRFMDAYVTSAVCGPSRAGLITGRSQSRFGFIGHPGPQDSWGLPLDEHTLSDALQQAGYRTAIFGKWHLGMTEPYRPTQRGFDEFYGFLSGMHDYWEAYDPYWGPIVEGNAEPAPLEQYLTFELADRTIDFVRRQAESDQPFFCWLSFSAPHTPMQAPDDYLERTRHLEGDCELRPVYAAMVMAMDDAIGSVLDTLEQTGVAENTLVIFISDNGGALIRGSAQNGALNHPLRGSKAQLWDGGIRVPLFMSWPGTIEAGRVSESVVSALDFFPTFASLSGADKPDNLEGLDLTDYLVRSEPLEPGRILYWSFYDTQNAVRMGDYKWTMVAPERGLFNIRQDISEARDLQQVYPEKLGFLRDLWQTWNDDNQKIPLSNLPPR